MLPDFPQVKAEIAERLTKFLRLRVNVHLGPLSQISRYRMFEGERRSLTRASGEKDVGGLRENASKFVLNKDEIPTMQLRTILSKLDETAEDMARQMAKGVYQTVSKAAEGVGNVVDAKSGKFDADTILAGLAKVHLDFDANGNAKLPELHIAPSLEKAVEQAWEQIRSEPEKQKAYTEIIEAKREEWRAREASRKLVG